MQRESFFFVARALACALVLIADARKGYAGMMLQSRGKKCLPSVRRFGISLDSSDVRDEKSENFN